MELIKFTLCPLCMECPEVEITDEGVRIGEDANTVRLSHPNGMNSSPSSSGAICTRSDLTDAAPAGAAAPL